ncbi:hypothetical protein E2C01_034367 [Portunus trituberculatus]|uniref:Ig-like domain-containing protein n=1 Tax=Portunus trituberculatus TaxID=210409 RepID=A0A5B7F6T0_PORTR|nr:hypothetical protein [Portunus trituberculatus]
MACPCLSVNNYDGGGGGGAAPHAAIIGSPDMYVDMGSTINLTCVISHTPEPPDYIKWTHNGQQEETLSETRLILSVALENSRGERVEGL